MVSFMSRMPQILLSAFAHNVREPLRLLSFYHVITSEPARSSYQNCSGTPIEPVAISAIIWHKRQVSNSLHETLPQHRIADLRRCHNDNVNRHELVQPVP